MSRPRLVFVYLAGASAMLLAADRKAPESVLFEELPVVEAASLHEQTLEEAPASVTVITQEDIRKYGYRTLGEALSRARGLYSSYDRMYQFIGVRGFGLPGDFNTRFLVTLNGHHLTERVYGSNNFFHQDFGLDLDLVKRIEIIRGPSSALHGSNGIFATINIVTRSPLEHERARVSVETGSFGEKKIHAASAEHLGRGANLLVSGSVYNTRGPDLYLPEFDSAGSGFGRAVSADGRRGYHSFANLVWHDWSFTAFFNDGVKFTPLYWGDFLFGDRGNRISDSRNFVEAAWSRDAGPGRLRWSMYLDRYHTLGIYRVKADEQVEDRRDYGSGEWLGTGITYAIPLSKLGTLTVGAEGSADTRNLQTRSIAQPRREEMLRIDRKGGVLGVFAQLERKLSARWTGYLGGRFDVDRESPSSVSPRLALVYQPSGSTSYKFLYGKAFRNPTVFEMYYEDPSIPLVANPALRPEHAHTFEVSAERRFARNFTLLATAYHYRIAGLIDPIPAEGYIAQFANAASARAHGFETEFTGKPASWIETAASLALQSVRSSVTGGAPSNSPAYIVNARVAAPLGRKLFLSAEAQRLGGRGTFAGGRVDPVFVADATVSSRSLFRGFDFTAGVRNLFDSRHYDPIALGQSTDRMRQDGRTLFVKLTWSAWE